MRKYDDERLAFRAKKVTDNSKNLSILVLAQKDLLLNPNFLTPKIFFPTLPMSILITIGQSHPRRRPRDQVVLATLPKWVEIHTLFTDWEGRIVHGLRMKLPLRSYLILCQFKSIPVIDGEWVDCILAGPVLRNTPPIAFSLISFTPDVKNVAILKHGRPLAQVSQKDGPNVRIREMNMPKLIWSTLKPNGLRAGSSDANF